MIRRSTALLSCASLAVFTFCAGAQRPGRVRTPGAVAISPDGALVAWTLRGAGTEGLRSGGASTLYVTGVANPGQDKIIAPGGPHCTDSDPVWSPDSQTLAFTVGCPGTDGKGAQGEIFLWFRSSGEIKQLTRITGIFKQATFSPDGKTLAFLFVKDASRQAGALDAMKPWAGVIGEDNLEIQGVYGVDTNSGVGSWLVEPTPQRYVFEYTWAPDSKSIAFIGAAAPGENNWWVAKLYTATAGSTAEVIFNPNTTRSAMHGLQMAVPRFSPDGKRIAFIGGLMSDFSSNGGDVWVVNADGKGEPIDVTPKIDGTPTYEAWLNDKTIGFIEDRRGHIVAPDYDVTTRREIPGSATDLGEVAVSGGPLKNAVSFTNKGVFAFVKSGLTAPPEVYVGPLDKLQQFTHLNDGAKPTSRVESVEWENEGFHVQGWITYPRDYDPAKKYPLIVTVHGGPSASVGPRFSTTAGWADEGYFEFQPNPRGSYGQGEAFTMANRKDFGYGDLRDILKGMDMLEAKLSIDKNREGLTGWSYGGFMAMFAITQTHRFRAAVAGAGVSNWQSYYGENSIDQWMLPFFGASVYDDPAVYAKSSAINFVKNVKTPTLIIVGDRDGECPAPQSFELWHALRAEGVKTQLVVYPNEGHGFKDPEHLRDRHDREVKWFAENMPASH
ncbi:Dipeptidyl aminopeptidase/acylaminoacyl peptidase [Bryocella elongata]|uniref:Dipeptidyl aminopeptidase/acylaminoacyl peptidase n=1 Tax=Bryocella elongata TaxID=863522 RepID=A0A1H6AKE3_9BACT|nr:S9 family peptidase [Bryocella elongata]SEG49199.1 Dipeptidyl aminopeptidase/acylaminoacyl peptidase [Bryocella elongata]